MRKRAASAARFFVMLPVAGKGLQSSCVDGIINKNIGV
jgi:hypothetical protein